MKHHGNKVVSVKAYVGLHPPDLTPNIDKVVSVKAYVGLHPPDLTPNTEMWCHPCSPPAMESNTQ
jgi:hypothetical protein